MSASTPSKQRGRRYIIWFVILIGGLLSFAAFAIYQYGAVDRAAPADLIIVLGAGTEVDGTPTGAQVRRVAHAVALYKRGLAGWLLCTGGFGAGRPVSEAQTCVDGARAAGVPAAAILREDISQTTLSNATEARRVMTAHHLHSAILVTDNFHLLRAEWLFHTFGMTIFVSPAQATQGPLPPIEALRSTLREVGALPWNVLRLWLLGAQDA